MKCMFTLLSAAVFTLCLVSCGGGGDGGVQPDTNNPPPPPTSHTEMLNALTFPTPHGTEREDNEGNKVSGHPLKTEYSSIDPINEYYFLGFEFFSDTALMFDDPADDDSVYPYLYRDQDDSQSPVPDWSAVDYKNCIGADVDGDGFDEIVNVYYAEHSNALRIIVMDYPEGLVAATPVHKSFTIATGITAADLPSRVNTDWPLPPERYFYPIIAKGNLDADYPEEVAIGFGHTLYVVHSFDLVNENVLMSTPKSYSDKDGYVENVELTIGNIIGYEDAEDNIDEIVVTHGGECQILQVVADGVLSEKKSFVMETPYNIDGRWEEDTLVKHVRVAIGNIDAANPGKKYLVFAGIEHHSTGIGGQLVDQVRAVSIDQATNEETWLNFGFESLSGDNNGIDWGNYDSYGFTLLDWDGDGIDEIFSGTALYAYDTESDDGRSSGDFSNNTKIVVSEDEFLALTHEDGNNTIQNLRVPIAVYARSRQNIVEVDGKLVNIPIDELIWVEKPYFETEYGGVHILTKDSSGSAPVDHDRTWGRGKTWNAHAAFANVDMDTTIVKFTGEHELLYSQPQILAVLAAPPFYAGTGQSEGCSTSYGQTLGGTTSHGQSASVSVSIGVGFEYEDDVFTQSKVAGEIVLSSQIGTAWNEESTNTFTINDICGPEDDKVVFTSIPFDVYYYEIVSAGGKEIVFDAADNEPLPKNTKIAISVPRGDVTTTAVSRTHYNLNNGDNLDVKSLSDADTDGWILQHTIGDPYSYPSASTDPGMHSNDTRKVGGVGWTGGGTEMEISEDNATTVGVFGGLGVTISATVGAGGINVKNEGAFEYGFEYDVTNLRGTTYSAYISELPWPYDDNPAYEYHWGLDVYTDSLGDNEFTVVNYWVTDTP